MTYIYQPRRVGKRPSARATKLLRVILLDRDGPYCGICGEWLDISLEGTHSPMAPSLDHIIALADGGTNELDNLQLAHRQCDSDKSSLSDKALPHGWRHGRSKANQQAILAARRDGLDSEVARLLGSRT